MSILTTLCDLERLFEEQLHQWLAHHVLDEIQHFMLLWANKSTQDLVILFSACKKHYTLKKLFLIGQL
jgi:hypothetical protein